MNFCDGCLDPKITSNKPGRDNYEVSNLISCDVTSRRKGFMGEYFIRPPIDITVDFLVPIDISHIKVGTQLEHMCTTGCTIFTRPEGYCQNETNSASSHSSQQANSSFSSPSSSSNSIPVSSFSGPSSSYSNKIDSVCSDKKDQNHCVDDVYFCIGKFFSNGENELLLRNCHYKHWIRNPLPALNSVTQSSNTFRGTIKHTNRQALRSVKSLLIRILRTSTKGPPVISSLEVWGQPSITTNQIDRKELFRKWNGRDLSQVPVLSVPRIYNSHSEETPITKPIIVIPKFEDKQEVPEDFLDPLTCDIMTVPLLLPSGHSIDAHSLERFIANEGTWGRQASDPFTGLPFRKDRQPTPNVPLKARIDRFLLLNGDNPDVKKSGRTVGSAFTACLAAGVMTSGSRKRPAEDPLLPIQPASKTLHEVDAATSRTESDLKLDNQVSIDDDESLDAEIEKALEGKPKYIPETVKAINFIETLNDSITDTGNNVERTQTSVSKNFKGQIYSKLRNSARSRAVKSNQKTSRNTIGSGHRFVQMIGGALSMCEGKAPEARAIPTHLPNAKPSTLICGDSSSNNFNLNSLNSVACLCGEQEGLYKLPCGHISCRNCLLHRGNVKPDIECSTCKQVCKRLDIVKYNKKGAFSSY